MIQEMTKPFAKEADDIGILIVNTIRAIKDKKSVTEIVAGELKDLMAAIDNIEKIGEEVQNVEVLGATLGYHIGAIPGILLKKPEAPAV